MIAEGPASADAAGGSDGRALARLGSFGFEREADGMETSLGLSFDAPRGLRSAFSGDQSGAILSARRM